ncbi:MAG TPA: site-specific DNA-methyltransferase [Methylomirabilota bacterium]|nr:site-specific DNA-methyltransferase [Methylomirabilota bacterium]
MRLAPCLTTDRGALYHADCHDLLAALRDGVIDCVFADPPFNLGKDYGAGAARDALARRDYLEWSLQWLDGCVRVLSPGGALFVYILPRWGYHLAAHLEARGLSFRHWIALSMKGTFPRGRKLYPAHYGILYFTKGRPKTFNRVRVPVPVCRHCGKDVKDYGGHRKHLHPAGLSLTDLWEDTAPARHRRFKARWHVNELKPAIPARCIQIATNEGDVVLDPFGGGGSTFEAAEALNRRWLGTELTTVAAIRARLRRHVTGAVPPLAHLFESPAPDHALRRR